MLQTHACAGIPPTVFLLCLVVAAFTSGGEARQSTPGATVPVRGLHTFAPAKKDLAAALAFIRESLPKEGVNTLIVEFNYNFDYQSRPEFADPSALGRAEVRQIAKACRDKGIALIPQINCLGHQSWAQRTAKLLVKHPEFDETPGKYPKNKGIYCRSYCPLHPEVHKVLFDLIDELIQACEAKALHVGMDEVFILADPDCPRCKGKDPADLFAGEVTALHAHLKQRGCRLWIWGDRFLDGKATGIGKWEASTNGTHPAIDRVPKDIVICDWHYGKAHKTPQHFAAKGFEVVACPWRNSKVALAQLAHIRAIRGAADKALAARALGMVQTTWCGFAPFLKAYKAQATGAAPAKDAPSESAHCFRTLFKAVGQGPEGCRVAQRVFGGLRRGKDTRPYQWGGSIFGWVTWSAGCARPGWKRYHVGGAIVGSATRSAAGPLPGPAAAQWGSRTTMGAGTIGLAASAASTWTARLNSRWMAEAAPPWAPREQDARKSSSARRYPRRSRSTRQPARSAAPATADSVALLTTWRQNSSASSCRFLHASSLA